MFSKLFSKIWGLTDGWKRIGSYILLQLPFASSNPWLIESYNKLVEQQNTANIVNFVLQIGLAFAMGHGLVKNVKFKQRS